MQGRSASEGAPPADRLSLTVSVLLCGGLLLTVAALYRNAQIDTPVARKAPPTPAARQLPDQQSARQPGIAGMAIRLPPPPAPAAAVPRTAEKPRVVEPLKRTTEKNLAAAPEKRSQPAIEPLKPSPRVVTPVAKPPRPAQPIEPPEQLASQSTEAAVNGARNMKSGGVLLRLLEHGQGPAIEIAWPRRAEARRALYRQLTRCYGVRAAVMAGGGTLYASAGVAGDAWTIDMDRFSGFIRSPQGETIAEEARVFAAIAARHGLVGWRPVRVFPRGVDAALLGGLGAVLGPHYKSARQIRAAYRWDRTGLVLGDFTVDGRPLAGSVSLPLPRGSASGCD